MKKFISILALLVLIALPSSGFAADPVPNPGNANGPAAPAPAPPPAPPVGGLTRGLNDAQALAEGSNLSIETNLTSLIQKILNFFLGALGIIAIAVLVWAGFMYILSLGDEGKTEKAKHMILYAVIGLIIVGLSATFVNIVLQWINPPA